MSKETITLIVNGVLALAVVVLCGLGRIPLEYGAAAVVMLAVPSAAPTIGAKLLERLAQPKPPPKGPSVLLLVLFGGVTTTSSPACKPAESAPASSPPCADAGDTVEKCAARYHAELIACTATSSTLAESIACENRVRAYFGKPLRTDYELALDGGAS